MINHAQEIIIDEPFSGDVSIMDSFKEKRRSQRKSCRVAITCSRFHSERCHRATATDFGAGGVRLVSEISYTPGTPISIRIGDWKQDIPRGNDNGTIKSYAVGEVKWCRKIDPTEVSLFEIGVWYFPT